MSQQVPITHERLITRINQRETFCSIKLGCEYIGEELSLYPYFQCPQFHEFCVL